MAQAPFRSVAGMPESGVRMDNIVGRGTGWKRTAGTRWITAGVLSGNLRTLIRKGTLEASQNGVRVGRHADWNIEMSQELGVGTSALCCCNFNHRARLN